MPLIIQKFCCLVVEVLRPFFVVPSSCLPVPSSFLEVLCRLLKNRLTPFRVPSPNALRFYPTYSVVILPLPDLLSVLGGIDEVRVAVYVILLYHSLQHTISLLVQSLHVTR